MSDSLTLVDYPTSEKPAWILEFGADSHSWNCAEAEDDPDSDESGLPGIGLVSEGLLAWAACWGEWPGDRLAGSVFNMPLHLIEEARPTMSAIALATGGVADSEIGVAIQLWSLGRGDRTTVGLAARAFNLHPLRIAEIVAQHPWMLLSGDPDQLADMEIEHDGE